MTNEERKLYQLHADRYLSKRIVDANRIIEQGLDTMQRPVISMSFGKDSVVMAHLILMRCHEVPMVHLSYGDEEYPDTDRVKSEFLDRFACNYHEIQGGWVLAAYREFGYFLFEEPSAERDDALRAYKEQTKIAKLKHWTTENGYDGNFIGMRRDESNKRKWLFQKRGALYFAKSRHAYVCCPIEKWSARDVWAYTVAHKLPYNRIYDESSIPRESPSSRISAIYANHGHRYGRLGELKRLYPDRFNRLAAEFPEITRYL